jgi:hypothetical protein
MAFDKTWVATASLFRGGTLIEEGRIGSASSVVDNEFSFRLCAGGKKQWAERWKSGIWTWRMFFFSPLLTYTH